MQRVGKKSLCSRSLDRYERGKIALVKARENDVATIDVQGGETYVPVMKQLQEYISPEVVSSWIQIGIFMQNN